LFIFAAQNRQGQKERRLRQLLCSLLSERQEPAVLLGGLRQSRSAHQLATARVWTLRRAVC